MQESVKSKHIQLVLAAKATQNFKWLSFYPVFCRWLNLFMAG